MCGGLQHSVARLFCAAGFGNHYAQGVREMIADPGEHAIEAVRVRVVEEVNVQRIVGLAEGVGDKLWSER